MNPSKSTGNEAREREVFQRFSLQARFQHIVLFTCTIVLCLTGIPMWCLGRPEYIWWTQALGPVNLSIEAICIIHRVAAVGLMGLAVYHTLYTIYTREGRREIVALLPMPKDLFDVIQNSLYFLHLSDKQPRFRRYSYFEKFDYWAVYWGCLILFVTGLALWFEELAAVCFPWMDYELAALIHADEAILCALALFIWHFYNVHFRPGVFPGTMRWWHGRMTREEMIEEHPLELEKITADE